MSRRSGPSDDCAVAARAMMEAARQTAQTGVMKDTRA
jgi:hypothetical protein